MAKAVVSMELLFSSYLSEGTPLTWLFWPFARTDSGVYNQASSIWAQPMEYPFSWEPQYWFTISPINPPGAKNLVPYDQHVGITEVSWILKGEAHELNHTGGAGDLMLEITVTNYSTDSPAYFNVWMMRADPDLNR